MGLIARMKRPINLGVTDEKAWSPWLWSLVGSQAAGKTVTEYTALTFSAVYCAINLISSSTSCLPLRLMREVGRKKTVATEKSVHRVLHTKYNPYMTAQIGREVLAAHVESWGNGYAEIVRNKMGEVVELWPIPPNRIRPEMVDGELIYYVAVDNIEIPLPREKVLHVPGLGFDGFMGYSVVALARRSIGMGLAMEEFGAKFFEQGAHPGLIASHPNKLSQQGHDNLSNELAKSYAGLGNAHRLMLLEEGMKVEKLGMSQEDSQFLESRQFQIPEIARWWNLPPHKLKDLTKSSFSNIDAEQISFVTDSVLPRAIRLETNFNMQLLTAREIEQGYYFKHSMEGLLRGDSKSRAEFYKSMFNIGAMSPDDIREKEDLDPLPDGMGNRYFVPMNMAALDQFDEEKNDDSEPSQSAESDQELPGRKQGRRGNLIPL